MVGAVPVIPELHEIITTARQNRSNGLIDGLFIIDLPKKACATYQTKLVE
jgi:hypothetical protein